MQPEFHEEMDEARKENNEDMLVAKAAPELFFNHITPCMKKVTNPDGISYSLRIEDFEVEDLLKEIDAALKDEDPQKTSNALLDMRRMFSWTADEWI